MAYYSLRKDKGSLCMLSTCFVQEISKLRKRSRKAWLFLPCYLETQYLAFLPGVYRLERGATESNHKRIFEDRILTSQKAGNRWLCMRAGCRNTRESTQLLLCMGPIRRAQNFTEQ